MLGFKGNEDIYYIIAKFRFSPAPATQARGALGMQLAGRHRQGLLGQGRRQRVRGRHGTFLFSPIPLFHLAAGTRTARSFSVSSPFLCVLFFIYNLVSGRLTVPSA